MREHTSPVYHQTLALWTPSKNRPANAVSGKVFLSGRQAQSLQRLKLNNYFEFLAPWIQIPERALIFISGKCCICLVLQGTVKQIQIVYFAHNQE